MDHTDSESRAVPSKATFTNSPWFWVAVYCGFGSLMLFGFGWGKEIFSFVRLSNDEHGSKNFASESKNNYNEAESSSNKRMPSSSESPSPSKRQRSNLAAKILAPILGCIALGALFALVFLRKNGDSEREGCGDGLA